MVRALDANVMLGLYQLGTSEREQVFGVLDNIKDRLWVPYQAGYEYQRKRLDVIARQAGLYESAKSLHGARKLADMKAKLTSLASQGLPAEARNEVEPLLSDLEDRLQKAVQEFERAVEDIARTHVVVTVAQAQTNDPVRDKLDDLLAGRVGSRPEEDKLETLIEKGLRRITERIPPGYMDQGKEDDRGKAGDFIIWSEILDHAKQSDRAVLFITNDVKQDWYERSEPRPELVEEFGRHSKHGYHQVRLSQFLELANTHLSASVDKATIDQVSSTELPPRDTTRLLSEFGKFLSNSEMARVVGLDPMSLTISQAIKAAGIQPRISCSDMPGAIRKGPLDLGDLSEVIRRDASNDESADNATSDEGTEEGER